jgi:hypothetical protein
LYSQISVAPGLMKSSFGAWKGSALIWRVSSTTGRYMTNSRRGVSDVASIGSTTIGR